MPPQSRSKGESKQGLIITLVFFILTTIGLGVATYFGFAEQERLTKDKDKAGKDAEVFKKERDQYKFLNGIYRSYMGKAQTLAGAADLGTQKTQFDQGTLKVNDDDAKIVKELGARFKWTGNKPNATYEDEIAARDKAYNDLVKKNKDFQKQVADAKDKQLKAEDGEKAAQADYLAKLNEAKNTSAKERDTISTDLDDLRKKVKDDATALKNAKETGAKEKTDLQKQLQVVKETEVKQLKAKLAKLESEISDARAKSTIAPASMRTDWKIIRMDRFGQNPYINLGSSDRVKPQLTFTIHSMGLDGRPNPRPKGTMEVVNVIRDHLSQAHITSVKDADRDPIVEGDIIYNPSWDPTLKKHIALAGTMDLTGDGRDSLYEFMRNLERQNVIIDAYQDPKDGSVKGQITLQTDYLILGENQEFSETGRGKQAADKGGKGEVNQGRQQMIEAAKEKKVETLPLSKYLEMIGYRLPRSIHERPPSLLFKTKRPDMAPPQGGEKPPVNGEKPPAMKPDK